MPVSEARIANEITPPHTESPPADGGPVVSVEEVLVTERPSMRERLVVSPSAGRFVPLPPETFTAEGEWVEPGQALAEVHIGGSKVPVRSDFRGWVMGMLALPGQPVHEGEALFWVWNC
jgi:biotin carboxyl carrier protein